MGVTPAAQGKGLGEALVREAIRRAESKGVAKLMLVTNSSLTSAVTLYAKLGFQETYRGKHPKYERGDLVMELDLKR